MRFEGAAWLSSQVLPMPWLSGEDNQGEKGRSWLLRTANRVVVVHSRSSQNQKIDYLWPANLIDPGSSCTSLIRFATPPSCLKTNLSPLLAVTQQAHQPPLLLHRPFLLQHLPASLPPFVVHLCQPMWFDCQLPRSLRPVSQLSAIGRLPDQNSYTTATGSFACSSKRP